MIMVNSSLVMGTSRLTAETSEALLQFNTPTTFLVLPQGYKEHNQSKLTQMQPNNKTQYPVTGLGSKTRQ